MATFYIISSAVLIPVAFYFAWQYRKVRKFLAGAFLVSSKVEIYLYLTNTTVPLIGTEFVQSPMVGLVLGAFYFCMFGLCLYTGFISKPRPNLAVSK
jgi:hypothetical protein